MTNVTHAGAVKLADGSLQDLLAKGIQIPAQPKVLMDFQTLVSGDEYNIHTLAEVISRDPGISANLFRIANSSVFHRSKRCDSIEQVISIIGITQTQCLIQAISLASSIRGEDKKSFEIFWQRSQDIAQLASLIASDRVSICNIFPEQAFLAGIFLESGSALLMQRFPTYTQQLGLDSNYLWPALADEDALFNVDHCSIGYLVSRHWKLPEVICRAIQYHHELPSEEFGEVRTMVAILNLAIHFYNISSGIKDPMWHKLSKEVLAEIGVDPEGERTYYEEIIERFLSKE